MLDINKCIWITGASTGIGKSLALKLAKEGFVVAVSARSIKNLNILKKESKSFKGSIYIFPLDISIKNQVISIFNKIEKTAPKRIIKSLRTIITTIGHSIKFL